MKTAVRQQAGWISRVALTLTVAVVLVACASSRHTPHKKLKPGKPIPCPLKDC